MHNARVEQRREVREELLVGQLLIVDLVLDLPAQRTKGVVLNISDGGMAVQTFRPIGHGRVSAIQFSCSKDTDPLQQCEGQVAWQESSGLAGIRFLQSMPELHQHIIDDLQANSDSALPPLFTCRDKSSGSEFDATLHLFACSAMALTGASGVAIALGDSSSMECRGSVGTAPEVGTKLLPSSGLSGQSLSTGAVILCDDAWSDTRVNRTAVEQMDSRSILAIPITNAENILGLLESFSKEPHHFNERHVEKLLPLVKILVEAVEEESCGHTRDMVAQRAGITHRLATDGSEPMHLLDKHFFDRSQLVPVALGGLVALLIVGAGLSLLSSRFRSKSVVDNNSGSRRQSVQPSKAVVRFDPEVIDEKIGKTFDVNVVLKGVKDLWSAPMQILYDPHKLQLVTVESGGLLDGNGQAATLVHRVDPSLGRVDVSVSRPLTSPGVSGDGVVFTLVFLTKAKGSSRLRVTQAGLRDTSTGPIPVDSSGATVTISEGIAERSGEQNAESSRASPSLPRLLPPSIAATRSPISEMASGRAANSYSQTSSSGLLEGPPPVTTIPPTFQPAAEITGLKLPSSVASRVSGPTSIRPNVSPSFELERTLKGHTKWVTAVSLSADGEHLVSGSWDQSLKLWDVSTGQMISTFASRGVGIQAAALSHDGKLIAAEDASNNIKIWNATTGKSVLMLKGDRPSWDRSWVYSIAFSPDDKTLAAARDSKTIRLWDVSSGRAVRDLTGSSRNIQYVAFSPDGRWLATGGDSKTIQIWNVQAGKISKTLAGHKQEICAVAFSPDGRWLATAGKDRTVKLWNVSNGVEVRSFTGHQDAVTTLGFSPNSRWLATSGWDKTIRIWNVDSGREVQILTGNTHQVYTLAFGTHGGWLATGSVDGTIRLWRLRPEIDLAVLGEDNKERAQKERDTASAAIIKPPK